LRREVRLAQGSGKFTAFAVLIFCVATAAFLAVAYRYHLADASFAQLGNAALLAVLALVGESLAVEFSDRMTLAASNVPILLAMMFLDPAQAMLVGWAVGAWGGWREESKALVLFNAANTALPALAGSLAFLGMQELLGSTIEGISAGLLLSGAVAGAVFEAGNLGMLGVARRLKYGRSQAAFWLQELRPFLKSLAILTGLGLSIAALYVEAGITATALLFIPLFAAQYMFKLLVEQKRLLAEQKQLSDEYLEMNIGLAAAMVVLLDSKDEYTASHSAAVAMYCRDMALSLGMSEDEAEALHLAGLLHDLGKVGTPDAILRKDGKLDAEEWAFIRQHPSKGAEVLSHLAAYKDVADIVRYHHERLDGSGYPYGIRDGQIPEPSKMLAVADAYHAMTSDRPYRPARSSFDALKELRRMSGVSLDGKYVELLASILRDKDLAYREGTSTDFMGEYERGRINLRLRAEAIAQISETMRARRDPAVG
jgi:putative nucleotidyltransferase with HDIG domain